MDEYQDEATNIYLKVFDVIKKELDEGMNRHALVPAIMMLAANVAAAFDLTDREARELLTRGLRRTRQADRHPLSRTEGNA
jgi:hypothetical protein